MGIGLMKTALVLTCDDNFIAYAAVVARRAIQLSTEKFPIIVVSDGVTQENKRLAQMYCSGINFVEASHLFGEKKFYQTANFARAVYLRLFLEDILADFHRIVYIDCDVSPLTDLSPLLRMVPTASPVIASYDLVQMYDDVIYDRLPLSRNAGYLQSGVMVLDLKAVREERIFKDTIQFALTHPEKCMLVDQDALSVVLQGRWQVMDWRWNVLHFMVDRMPKPYYMRHLTGNKPWGPSKFGIEKTILRQWRDDLAESPWPEKFAASQDSFLRTYVRPITTAIERPIKLWANAKADNQHGRLARYLKALPGMLTSIDEMAANRELARNLW